MLHVGTLFTSKKLSRLTALKFCLNSTMQRTSSDGSGHKSWRCYAPKPLGYSPVVTGPPSPPQAPILPAGKISGEDDNYFITVAKISSHATLAVLNRNLVVLPPLDVHIMKPWLRTSAFCLTQPNCGRRRPYYSEFPTGYSLRIPDASLK